MSVVWQSNPAAYISNSQSVQSMIFDGKWLWARIYTGRLYTNQTTYFQVVHQLGSMQTAVPNIKKDFFFYDIRCDRECSKVNICSLCFVGIKNLPSYIPNASVLSVMLQHIYTYCFAMLSLLRRNSKQRLRANNN